MPAIQHTRILSQDPASSDAVPSHAEPPGRLKKRAEFLRVASKGRKAPMPGLVLQAMPRQDDLPARLGFTVTKKVGNAVVRNPLGFCCASIPSPGSTLS